MTLCAAASARGVSAPPRGAFDRCGNLQSERLSDPYKQRLVVAGSRLGSWLETKGLTFEAAFCAPLTANKLLVEYVQLLFERGEPLGLAVHTVLAVQTARRELKGALREAWDSVQSWKLRTPVVSRVPMPLAVLEALRIFSVLAAIHLDRNRGLQWWSFAAILGAGFWGLCRPKELLNLRRSHVRVPGTRTFMLDEIGVLTIEEPKNRASMGRLQVRSVRDGCSVRWLQWLVQDRLPEELLWPFPTSTFGLLLQLGLQALGLKNLNISPASLRAGGATTALSTGTPLSNLQFHGGWASTKSMAAYLQEAESAAALLDISAPAAKLLHHLLNEYVPCRSPPAIPFVSLRRQWIQQKSPRSSPLPAWAQ
jgi:hypothetical protein